MECNKQKQSGQDKESFINEITGLIYKLADDGFDKYRGPNQLQPQIRDEMLSAAYLGAAKAADLYDCSAGVKPATFAYDLIWCSILNHMTYLSSSGFTPAKSIKEKRPDLIQMDPYASFASKGSDNDYGCGEHGIEWALNLISNKRNREIVKLRLVDDLTFCEIAERLRVTSGRVSQIFDATIARISDAVKERIRRGKN